MQLSLKQIRYFLAAAETGQFSTAASKAHVTQTAVTAAIRDLEGALGFPLFDRHHATGVTLTADGQRFLLHAQNIASAVNGALTDPSLLRRDLSGRLKIGATHSILGSYIVPAFGRFSRAFPGIRVELLEMQRAEVEALLLAHKLDLGIMWLANMQRSDVLDSVVLTRSRRQLWLGSEHALLARRNVSLADVATEPYVLYDMDETPKNTERFWKSVKLKPNIAYRVTSIEALRSFVAQGLAITVLSDAVYRPFSSEGLRIFTRPLQEGLGPIEIGLVWSRRTVLSEVAAAFKTSIEMSFSVPTEITRSI
jgi:DNA-binding transcriptional LysR family regulator